MDVRGKAGRTGFEPATSGSTVRHSRPLNYRPELKCSHIFYSGAGVSVKEKPRGITVDGMMTYISNRPAELRK